MDCALFEETIFIDGVKMKKRVIVNWDEVVEEIKVQSMLELAYLFPELGKRKIKKVGSLFYAYKILCPFHAEKTPSLVYHKGYFWLCFGCGQGGTIIDYYMKRKCVSFQEAIFDLVRIFKIKIEWRNVDT